MLWWFPALVQTARCAEVLRAGAREAVRTPK
jgi:hypothetical protein